MRSWIMGVMLLLLASFVFAAENGAGTAQDEGELAVEEAQELHAEGAEGGHQGMELGQGLQLVAFASLGSLALLVILYVILARR